MAINAASPQYPPFPFQTERDRALAYLRSEWDSTDGWNTFDNKDGVTYQKKVIPGDDSAIPMVRGRGIVEGCTPSEFLTVMNYPGARTSWDPRTDSAEITRRWGRQLSQFYTVQKGLSWIISPRDIVGLQDTIFDDSGTIERVQCSVDDPHSPPVSGKVRATLTIAGWVLRPLEKGTDVTYMVKINPNGSIPTTIINGTIVPEIPAAIRRCDNLLKDQGHPPYITGDMKSVLLSEDFTFTKKEFIIELIALAGDHFIILYDPKMHGQQPKVTIEGDGKEGVEVARSGGKIGISLTDKANENKIKITVG